MLGSGGTGNSSGPSWDPLPYASAAAPCRPAGAAHSGLWPRRPPPGPARPTWPQAPMRSEEHTPELQPRSDLAYRLLLEKKKKLVGAHPLVSCDCARAVAV